MFWLIFLTAVFNTVQILSLGLLCLFLMLDRYFSIESVFICSVSPRLRNDAYGFSLLLVHSVVNRCRLVMKLDKFLCFMFLFAFLALTLHKTRQKQAFFGRITNQKLRLIYSKLT